MKLPKLYNSSSSKKFKVWEVEIFDDRYEVTHGFEGCKMQTQKRPVEEKNIGRANYTTKAQQAEKEALAKWQKQIDNKGYREKKEDIGVNDYIHPMKSGHYKDRMDKVVFPCWVSPKLNGVKTIVPKRNEMNEGIKYQTSGGKYYTTLNHLDKEIDFLFHSNEIPDGEVYIHGVDLQDISSAVKKHNELTEKLEYWVYDLINTDEYDTNLLIMKDILEDHSGKIKLCPVEEAHSHEEIDEIMYKWVALGYEGVIVRNKQGIYKHGPNRSMDCLKRKDFEDSEFKIIDYESDVHGRVVWWCETEKGDKFKVVPKGSHKKREKWYNIGKNFIGKFMTVRFLELSKDGIPQGNPVGHGDPKDIVGECVRDYE